jgi:cyanate lyase
VRGAGERHATRQEDPGLTREQTTQEIVEAMAARDITFGEVAGKLNRPKVWTAAALLGQHPFEERDADAVVELLGLSNGAASVLRMVPTRGALEDPVPTDPTIYRLYEVLQVYGPALKALIHEEFGDGIMSAIAFNMDLEREEHEDGDRVKISMSGKFLPYKWA